MLGDAGREKRVALQVENLGNRNAHDEWGSGGTLQTVVFGARGFKLGFAEIHITKQITFSKLRKGYGVSNSVYLILSGLSSAVTLVMRSARAIAIRNGANKPKANSAS